MRLMDKILLGTPHDRVLSYWSETHLIGYITLDVLKKLRLIFVKDVRSKVKNKIIVYFVREISAWYAPNDPAYSVKMKEIRRS